MKVENVGKQTIKIEATYSEIAKIVDVLDNTWVSNDNEDLKKLAYQLHNSKVK